MISAIILSHNDGDSIEKTLDSLTWCDELIVIDDASTDNTREIVKKHKATVIQHALDSNFAAQRNIGLAKAKYEWILFVDSDEVVPEKLAQEIKSAVSLPGTAVGYSVKRNDWMWGRQLRHGETANVRLLRLAKKNAGKWERPVHEVWEVNGEVRELSYPLLHYPHPNVAQFLDNINFYSSLNARYLYEQHAHSPWWRIVLNPTAKFVYNYIFRLGFLDGTPGAIVAFMMSFHSFLTRGKLYLLQHRPHET
jgi:glycosyltransferase involved in cell wall biosynthesis